VGGGAGEVVGGGGSGMSQLPLPGVPLPGAPPDRSAAAKMIIVMTVSKGGISYLIPNNPGDLISFSLIQCIHNKIGYLFYFPNPEQIFPKMGRTSDLHFLGCSYLDRSNQ